MLTASIVTYHTPSEELRRCLSTLERSAAGRVWVVDNAADPATERLCRDYSKTVYVAVGDNPGYGAAHNIALRAAADAGAAYHLVLNSDTEFGEEVLRELTQWLDAHPRVGMAQPRILCPDGSDARSCRALPTPFDLVVRRFLPQSWFRRRRNRYLLTHLDPDKEHNIPYHQGSFMMLRMEAIAAEGGFDERFFMYPEDIDLTRRIHRHWQTMYVPSVRIVHHHRAASRASWRMLAVHIVNIVRYFNKYGWFHDSERSRFNAPLFASEEDGMRESQHF